jgi:dihydrofolate reductase
MADGWDGRPPGGIDHVVVVTHRPKPEGWDPEAPFHFVDGVEAAVVKAQELAGDRMVEVAGGDVGGQVLAAGLIDEVRAWTSYPSCSGPASATSGRSTRSTCWRILTR